jgi:hypothetical protein
MNSPKNITLIFKHFEIEHFGKDVFLVPYYLGKINNMKTTIVYPRTDTNKHFPSEIRGIKLSPLNLKGSKTSHYLYRNLNFIIYVIFNARKIDVLMRFHLRNMTSILGIIYKKLNPMEDLALSKKIRKCY